MWVGTKLFSILVFVRVIPGSVVLTSTVRVRFLMWKIKKATIIQICNTSSKDSVSDISFKKNLQFFYASEDCCKQCMLCIGNYGTGDTGRCSSSKHWQMGTVDSTVWTHIRLVHVETFPFLTNFKSVYMKSVQDAVDRMTAYNELHFLIERT